MRYIKTCLCYAIHAAAICGILFLVGDLPESTCDAHSGIFIPIPPPPPNDMVPGQVALRPNSPITNGPGAPASPGPRLGMPMGPQGTMTGPGSGASTKKIRKSQTQQITWEHWWARNRYQYLDFAGVLDKSGMHPITPKPVSAKEKLEELKALSMERIRPMLEDKAARKRRGALISLARLGDFDSFPMMITLLTDPNQTVRDAALLALGILDRHEAKHTLLHVAKGTKSACKALDQTFVPDYLRGYAQVSLALEEMQGIDTLLHSIALDLSSPPEVRAMALEGIGLLGGDDNARFLLEFAEDKKSPDLLLAAAVSAMGKSREPFTIPYLEKCLNASQAAVRQSASVGLGLLAKPGDERTVKNLYRTFRHSNDQALKGFSLVSIGQIGGPLAIQYLDHVLTKGRNSEQGWACLGLGLALRDAKCEQAESHLVHEAFTNSNRSTRGAAAIALGLARSNKGAKKLVKALRENGDPAYRGYIALSLGMINEPTALGPLRRVLIEEDNPQVRAQAAQALALMNDTESAPDIVTLLLESSNDTTKVFAALSLSFMGDLRIAETILEKMEVGDLDDLTTLHCAQLLSKLLSGKTAPYLERVAAGSNFASEYPLVGYLLNFDI
jgi:HEAT repeat protein